MRQAVNWAINRKAILQPSGYGAGVPADKYLPPQISGSPEEKSDLPARLLRISPRPRRSCSRRALKTLTAVLYTCNQPPCPDRAAIIQQRT